MGLSRKNLKRAKNILIKDLFFGRTRFKFLKKAANQFLHSASQNWPYLPKPITKKDKEIRKHFVGVGALGALMLSRIREAEEWRKKTKKRRCRYKKFENNEYIIFELSFYKLFTKTNETRYIVINKKTKRKYNTQFIIYKMKINFPLIEEGRYKQIYHFFCDFNFFFYSKKGKNYGYNFTGKSNEKLKAIKLTLKK